MDDDPSRSHFQTIGWNDIPNFKATWYGSPLFLAAKTTACYECSSLDYINLKQVGTCAMELFVVCKVSGHGPSKSFGTPELEPVGPP